MHRRIYWLFRKALRLLFAIAALALSACGGSNSLAGAPSGPVQHTATRDDWPMYAHDERHTSASSADLSNRLQVAWRYDPTAISGDTFSSVFNAVATVAGIYVHYDQFGSTVFAGGPSIDGISPSGSRLWNYVEYKDYDEGHWVSVLNSDVVFQDDGQGFLDSATGDAVKTPSKKWASGFDMWGESIVDASGVYTANTFLADGSDLFVYSLDPTGAARWTANQQKSTKYSQDSDGGIVLGGGQVFYAADYTDPSPFASGLYAFDATTGQQALYVATTPTSDLSADASNVYLVENGTNLVARAQTNLHQVWSVSVAGASSAAPVLADGLVIVASGSGVEAHDATTGKLAWAASVSPAYGGQYGSAMCAALGTHTLLVAGYDGLHLLKLSSGHELWHEAVSGVVGTAANPIIVNDPARGAIVYVTDSRGVIALVQTP